MFTVDNPEIGRLPEERDRREIATTHLQFTGMAMNDTQAS